MERDSSVVILVADDEEVVRRFLCAVLQRHDYHLLIAKDGVEALTLARKYNGHIDLLLSDIDMPALNGIELARQLSAERPAMRILLMSGTPDHVPPASYSFLEKPFTLQMLASTIHEVLEGAPADGTR